MAKDDTVHTATFVYTVTAMLLTGRAARAATLAALASTCTIALAACTSTGPRAEPSPGAPSPSDPSLSAPTQAGPAASSAASPSTSAVAPTSDQSTPAGSAPGSPSVTSSVPLPSPSGTWKPPARKAANGPTAPPPVPTRKAALNTPVSFTTDVTVSLVSVQATSVTASTPGEVSGPAVRVTVKVHNRSKQAVDVSSAVVSLTADKDGYGIGTTAGKPSPLQGSVAPGSTTSGSYVFMLNPAKARAVTISVNYAAGEPIAIFTGRTA